MGLGIIALSNLFMLSRGHLPQASESGDTHHLAWDVGRRPAWLSASVTRSCCRTVCVSAKLLIALYLIGLLRVIMCLCCTFPCERYVHV